MRGCMRPADSARRELGKVGLDQVGGTLGTCRQVHGNTNPMRRFPSLCLSPSLFLGINKYLLNRPILLGPELVQVVQAVFFFLLFFQSVQCFNNAAKNG